MKQAVIFLLVGFWTISAQAQLSIDTLAFQDFEVNPATPTWTYTGTPNAFNSGFSSANNAPPNSPIGIGGSRAWWLVQVSSGNPVTFDNQTIPAGYDSIRVRFRLAAMNLNGSGNGPDNLDYVLLAYSTDGGSVFSNRIRVRGATTNNSWWPYSATGLAKAYYLPATEVVFQPTTSGLQSTSGYSTVELTFPGSISQLSIRITPRSSASGDHWLIDNLTLTGENSCSNSTASITASACDSYISPSGKILNASGTYLDTIPNGAGCDSIISINLSLAQTTTDTLSPVVCNSYTSPSGHIFTSDTTFEDTLTNAANCDSLIYIQLTLNTDQFDTISDTSCFSYTSPGGNIWTSSGTYQDTIATLAGCDSVLTINLVINQVDTSVTQIGDSLVASASGASYQWIDCGNGNMPIAQATGQAFLPSASGSYAVIVTQNGCVDTSNCRPWSLVGIEPSLAQTKIWPIPVSEILFIELNYLGNPRGSVFDLSGRKILEINPLEPGLNQIALKGIEPGIYIVKIEGGEELITKKIVVK